MTVKFSRHLSFDLCNSYVLVGLGVYYVCSHFLVAHTHIHLRQYLFSFDSIMIVFTRSFSCIFIDIYSFAHFSKLSFFGSLLDYGKNFNIWNKLRMKHSVRKRKKFNWKDARTLISSWRLKVSKWKQKALWLIRIVYVVALTKKNSEPFIRNEFNFAKYRVAHWYK